MRGGRGRSSQHLHRPGCFGDAGRWVFSPMAALFSASDGVLQWSGGDGRGGYAALESGAPVCSGRVYGDVAGWGRVLGSPQTG